MLLETCSFSQEFHFVIFGYKKASERMIQAINIPDKNNSSRMILNLEYVKSSRKEKQASQEVIDLFENYDVLPVKWSERTNILELLQA